MKTNMGMNEILIKLDIEKVNRLSAICSETECDVNVMCGRQCVDGKSVMGVAQFVGRVVSLIPITDDAYIYETFYRKVAEIGGFKKEGY